MTSFKKSVNTAPVYIVDGARTPFIKAQAKRGAFSASDLAVSASRALLMRQKISPSDLDEVVLGCMMPSEDEANIGRIVGLRLGCDISTPGWTVQRNCASAMQAIDSGAKDIMLQRSHLVLAGGTEAMSRAPLLYNPAAVDWFSRFMTSKSLGAKLSTITKFRPHYLKPIIGLQRGLTDFLCNYNMGQTAELLAYDFNITRKEMDEYALQSQQRAIQAQDDGLLDEITPSFDKKGNVYNYDSGVRRDSSLERLTKLRPNFDKKFGQVTAGNSSQVTDGAAIILLASEEAVKQYQLPVLGRLVDTQWSGCDPKTMGLGPSFAVPPLLKRNNLSLSDINYWEINEAFSAQLLACLKAWESEAFCQTHLGLDKALGTVDLSRVNIDGGAIALGHPVGATGARIVLHALNVLKRNQQRYAIASLCIGGGQGGAMLLERIGH